MTASVINPPPKKAETGFDDWMFRLWALVRTGATFDGVLNALLDLSGASAGQIKFPASQHASADANTLDDYEEGTWTPVLTFATPGNISVSYSIQVATYTKIGRQVETSFSVLTSAFTHTTASGVLVVTGLPFTATSATSYATSGTPWYGGIDLAAGYSQLAAAVITSESQVRFVLSGDNVAALDATTTHAPSGNTILMRSSVPYIV